jgi:NADH dehydrogenase
MKANIPEVAEKRIVILGGGFGGLRMLRKLMEQKFQLVLIDKNNYHQFQPLFYQVATAGLEPSAIAFPFRKIFQSRKNVFIRMTEVIRVDAEANRIYTRIGHINYDILVIATGSDTNYFDNSILKSLAYPMKSVSEALGLRNRLLENYENALITVDPEEKQGLLNVVVVGGGPTGVELSGAIAEMKRFILPKDYPELNFNNMHIYLLEASPALLNGMSKESSEKAYAYLLRLGVKVWLNSRVRDYDGKKVFLENGSILRTDTFVWAAGVKCYPIDGLNAGSFGKGNRLLVDPYSRVTGYDNVYAIGDIALMPHSGFPNGHPQVAQVAIQQATILARNLVRMHAGKQPVDFRYKNLGSMATIGRNLAVVDLPFIRFQGFLAWLFWMLVHLMSIVGVKNRLLIFINWLWNYFTYDQALRLIIRPRARAGIAEN